MIVHMENIVKSFGSNEVLKDVSFTIRGGEICALIGENGAGKSTLMNILGGIYKMDSGAIYLDDKKVAFNNPRESLSSGIAFIHQELNLINDLPIYENLFLGRELKKKGGALDLERMVQETEEIFKKMKVELNPKTMVRELDTSYKQIIEICRAMMMNSSLIIMDEPTTSLTDQEIQRVFSMMRTLKEHKVAIIFISHKLNEVMEVCDRYMVLRNGSLVLEGHTSTATTKDLAQSMVGHELRRANTSRGAKKIREVMRVDNLTHKHSFRNTSFSINSGEILGVTGLLGDGRSDLFRSIFGSEPIVSGKIYLEGIEVKVKSTVAAMKKGIGYLPGNRKENAIIKDMNIIENASIVTWGRYSRKGIIDIKKHQQIFRQHVDTLKIKLQSITNSINSLSGGNQQKVVLAKWLAANPKILILDNPTQGVDVGAKEDIYEIILKLLEEDIAVVVLSSEAQEVIRLCDRAIVMYHGVIQGEVTGEHLNEQDIMQLATGGHLH